MPPPTDEQLQLIKDFEPVLFFHAGDATVPEERFFPSDAKRYLEHCALWKASAPFLTLGDWGNMPVVKVTCVSIVLDRPSPSTERAPKWIGLSNRNTGIIKVGDKGVRTDIRVLPWSPDQTFQDTQPRLAVARGSHALYLTTEQPSVVGPLTSNDPTTGSCGLSEAPAGEIPPLPEKDSTVDIFGVVKGIFIEVAKIAAGAGIGSVLGPVGAAVGGLAGLVAGAIENSSGLEVVGVGPEGPSSPTVDTVNTSSGKVVHPKGMRPPDADQSRAVEWQSQDNFVNPVNGRRYDSSVDRDAQILWPGDPMYKGYIGRWGPRMESDPQTSRAGMRFPNFWLLFFDALVRNAHLSHVRFLTVGSGTWTVPSDWNNANNRVECLGAGCGGRGSGGGGGAYAKSVNVNLTPGTSVTYSTDG